MPQSQFCKFASFLAAAAASLGADWKPGEPPLMTRWGRTITAESVRAGAVHAEYPRPQLVRDKWLNLNGLWRFSTDSAAAAEKEDAEEILVPFPIESALSGVMRHAERIWYRRTFEVPADWKNQRIWLRFGAVDWEATVSVNGKELGAHRGGYDPFGFDITDALRETGPQELAVAVFDPTDAGNQPHGKQHLKPEGIWYTPTTGIWQTVWLEPLPESSIAVLKIVPDVDAGRVRLTAHIAGAKRPLVVEATALDADGRAFARGPGLSEREMRLSIPKPRLWSPSDPYLYSLRVKLLDGDKTIDEVGSYFGLRKIEVKPVEGITRLVLNGEPLFEVGPLDQGFWPDGLYAAPSDEALRYDIEVTKRLGFNLTRKHVKVEPERWYYWCDKLGLLVWQDMPHSHRSSRGAEEFEAELRRMVEGLANHPSIILWVVFNEGWGQYDTPRLTALVKTLDPARLVSNASGWTDKDVGDIIDMHRYPGPGSPPPEPKRAAVLGEFGGLGLAVEGHVWTKKAWSYRGTQGSEQLTYGYLNLLERVWELRDKPGLSAAVYTQLTDVEGEINGLLTYDREVIKVDVDRVAAANRGQFPKTRPVLATARTEPVEWRYTFEKPADNWTQADFDASGWSQGPAGFGSEGTPGAIVRSPWKSTDIWLRREFALAEIPQGKLVFDVHHDEDVEIYIRGVLAAKAGGYTTDYEWLPISAAGAKALRSGKNVIAVHCQQTGGGQYIDVGMVAID